MIDKTHQLSVRQQSQLIQINRSTLYYKPKEISSTDLSLMRLIDEIHLDDPFMGSRMIRDMLQRQGHQIGRRKVRRLMRLMVIHALYSQTTLLFIQDSKKTRNNSSTESINHSLRLRLTHAHICSIGFKSGLYAGSQRILCPCCSNNS